MKSDGERKTQMHPLVRILLLVAALLLAVSAADRLHLGNEARLKKASTAQLQQIVHDEPGNWRAKYRLGLKLGIAESRYNEAYQVLKPLAQEHVKDDDVQYSFAQAAIQTKHMNEAVEALEKALRLNPQRKDTRNQLASIYTQCGLFPEAAAELERIVQNNPTQPQVWSTLGRAYLWLGFRDRAGDTFSLLNRRMSMMGDGYVGLGLVALERGDLVTAEPLFRQGLRAYRIDRNAYRGLAKLYLKKPPTGAQAETAAQNMRDAIEAFPHYALPHFILGDIELAQHQSGKALKEYETASRLPRPPAQVWQRLASLYGKPGNTDRARSAEKQYQTAHAADEQAAELQKAVNENPKDADRKLALARFYAQQGQLAQAWVQYTAVLKGTKDARVQEEARVVRQKLLAGEQGDLGDVP